MGEEVTDPNEQSDSKNFAKVRTRAEQAEARAEALAAKVKSLTVKAAGFDASDPVVALVLDKWNPEGDDAATPESFAEFAKGYKLAPASGPDAPAAPTQAEQQLDQLQAAGDQLRQASTTPTPTPTLKEQINEAQAKGEWDKAAALKTQSLLESMKP